MDYGSMMREIREIEGVLSGLLVQRVGRSLLGREIPCLSFGRGRRTVLYVGAHHGMEHLTAGVLLKFRRELLTAGKGTVAGVSAAYLLETRRYLVLPMLNPDGVSLAAQGLSSAGILSERLLRMNGGSRDFTKWQANARGVDLNHNYDAGFWEYKTLEGSLGIEGGCPTRYAGEYPASEPETAALTALIDLVSPELILTLHTQGGEIYYTAGEYALPRSASVARAMARHAGYRAGIPEGAAAYGGLTDYAVSRLGIPSYTVECGRGENPLPSDALQAVYREVRPLLWLAPVL